jgi:23S rRNA G2445 N2-methylase RlmL
MATCAPGAELIVAGEIRAVYERVNNVAIARGKVIFDCPAVEMDLNGIKCADNLYKMYKSFHAGNHKAGLMDIGARVRGIDFNVKSSVPPRVVVSASRRGKHAYSRFDAAELVKGSLVATKRFIAGDHLNHDIAIRLDIDGDSCSVYRQLTSPQMRFRGDSFRSVPGGIRPSLAHCLVRLSEPQSDDIFYDPFCGAGTIPFERSAYKSKKIFASDIDHDILEIARRNIGSAAIVFQANAVRTKMKDRGVDKVVANMPWGKQIKVHDISALYRGFLCELKRMLSPRGKAVILTDQVSAIETLCAEMELTCSHAAELSLHGSHPVIFIITATSDY